MILNITISEFSALSVRGKKKIFADFIGHKVDEIAAGGMTNNKWGQYTIRHETYAYSKIKIDPTEKGLVHITIYDYQSKRWKETI